MTRLCHRTAQGCKCHHNIKLQLYGGQQSRDQDEYIQKNQQNLYIAYVDMYLTPFQRIHQQPDSGDNQQLGKRYDSVVLSSYYGNIHVCHRAPHQTIKAAL